MQDFYIPLTALNFDLDRLKVELDTYVKPKQGGTAITVTQELAELDNYDFTSFDGITYPDANGIRSFKTGELDTDLVFYPKVLRGSYIQIVERDISSYLGLSLPRVRLSKFVGGLSAHKKTYLDFHTDPHTPYRVHIALDVMPAVYWKFKTQDQEYRIHQPADGVPVLIEVAETAHAVDIPTGNFRYHLWFQYHKPVNKEILDSLLNKAHNK